MNTSNDLKAHAIYNARSRNILIAYWLGAWFGTLGVHRFYIGGAAAAPGFFQLTFWPSTFLMAVSHLQETNPFTPLMLIWAASAGLFVLADVFLTASAVHRRNEEIANQVFKQ